MQIGTSAVSGVRPAISPTEQDDSTRAQPAARRTACSKARGSKGILTDRRSRRGDGPPQVRRLRGAPSRSRSGSARVGGAVLDHDAHHAKPTDRSATNAVPSRVAALIRLGQAGTTTAFAARTRPRASQPTSKPPHRRTNLRRSRYQTACDISLTVTGRQQTLDGSTGERRRAHERRPQRTSTRCLRTHWSRPAICARSVRIAPR